MAEILMIIVSGLLIIALAVFGIVMCIAMCVGVYEILTGKYKTQHDRMLECLNEM